FQCGYIHKVYYEILNMFAHKQIKKLIITEPPQHGKSEGSTRRLPSYILGIDPDRKIAIGSYNQPFARKFNRDNQRIIDSHPYHNLFPDTTLNRSSIVTVSTNSLRNADEFEVVGYKGGVKAVGRGGALTGNPVDTMIMDDIYKDYAEGNSPIILESAWDWYTSVVRTRLHNDSQQLIVFTRWNENDLIGRLEETENVVEITDIAQIKDIDSNSWVKINFEAIKTGNPTPIDPREAGEPLWPERHSKEKLLEDRALDPEKFECLHQGNPKPKEGLLYSKFLTYTEYPTDHLG
ncbi:MAG: terminase, partial [Deltaproteobacteria bacterium]|nr:terminase [Deltaproteobacteria bacterium]